MKPRPKGLPRNVGKAWPGVWKWFRWKTSKGNTPKPLPPVPEPPKPAPKPAVTLYMFDDINIGLIPPNAKAVAGYVDGKWKTWQAVNQHFPNARKLSIAVFPADDADCLDVEPGDATPAQAPAWVKRQHARGKRRPVLYTNASSGQALINAMTRAGLKYGVDYLWWSAHYDPRLGQHLCSPKCGFGLKQTAHATQFTDKALGRSLDESVCGPGFFD